MEGTFNPDTSTNVVSVTRLRFGARYSGLNDNLIVDAEGLVDNAFSDIWKSDGKRLAVGEHAEEGVQDESSRESGSLYRSCG